jgi:prepilin-type N-terminal cleavage/methylation domain-containing protein
MLGRESRRGVTLVEILIVMAILATLAAVLYPSVAVQLRRGQTSALANQFNYLRESIANYRENVTKYPYTLTQLTVQPVVNSPDLCNALVLTATQVAAWRGPYIAQNIVGNIPVGDATVRNQLERNPPTTAGGQLGMLRIIADGVTLNAATDLEQQFDGNANFATGTVLYDGVSTLTFQIPIRGC